MTCSQLVTARRISFLCHLKFDQLYMQEVAKGGEDPVSELAAQGVYIRESAVCYLTPCQLAAITADLEAMEDSLAVELTSWLVNDCLVRAVRANERMPAQR